MLAVHRATIFCRSMLCISAVYAAARCLFICLSVCLSARLSVTFVHSVKTSKHILYFFTFAILIFPYQTLWQFSDGDPLTGEKQFLTNIRLRHPALLDRRVSSTFRRRSIGYSTYAPSVSRDQQTPQRHASVNFVYDRKPKRYAEENKAKFHCTHW